jgi:hypothetical protein
MDAIKPPSVSLLRLRRSGLSSCSSTYEASSDPNGYWVFHPALGPKRSEVLAAWPKLLLQLASPLPSSNLLT